MTNRLRRWRTAAGAVAVAGLLVAACGGDEDSTDTTAAPETTAESTETTEATEPSETTEPEAPTGDSRFTGTDAFCQPDAGGTYENTASDQGVTEDTITFVHVRSKLEELADIGFGVDVGDVTSMWQAFVDEINDCGGINGRQLEMITVEYSLLDPASRDGVCVAVAEDNSPFAALSSTSLQGSANACLVEEKQIPVFNTQGVRLSLYESGYYVTTDFPQDVVGRAVAEKLIASGELEGKTVGFISSDAADVNEIVEAEIRTPFEEAGIEVVSFDVIGCGGTSSCGDGLTTAVENLIAGGADVFLPAGLNITTLPAVLAEIATQDPSYRPTIYNMGLQSMAGDLPTSKVAEFGGQPAIDLYNGTTIISFEKTGAWRTDPAFDPGAFAEMCAETYAGRGGERYEVFDNSIKYGMVGSICSEIRVFARAIEAVGSDLTRAAFVEAVQGLGEVDVIYDTGGDLQPGKTWFANTPRTLRAEFPCPQENSDFQGCLVPVDLEGTPVE